MKKYLLTICIMFVAAMLMAQSSFYGSNPRLKSNGLSFLNDSSGSQLIHFTDDGWIEMNGANYDDFATTLGAVGNGAIDDATRSLSYIDRVGDSGHGLTIGRWDQSENPYNIPKGAMYVAHERFGSGYGYQGPLWLGTYNGDGGISKVILSANGNNNLTAYGANVGIRDATPSQLLTGLQGGGNALFDGYDTHSLAEYKENIQDATAGAVLSLAQQYMNTSMKTYDRKITLDMLVPIARRYIDKKFPDAEFSEKQIRQWIINNRDKIEPIIEKRLKQKVYGLVADSQETPDRWKAYDDEGNVTGVSISSIALDNAVMIKALVQENQQLKQRIAALEGQ